MSTRALRVTDDVELVLAVPEDASAMADSALPAIDPRGAPGATIALRQGWNASGADVYAVCARAPSDSYAPGVEALALSRASALVEGALGGSRVTATAPVKIGVTQVQEFGSTGDGFVARGRHVLGFAGARSEALLCTVLCVDRSKGEGGRCRDVVDPVELRGGLRDAPPPGLVAHGLVLAATNPLASALVACTLAIAATAWILARRPRRPC